MKDWLKHLPFIRLYAFPEMSKTDLQEVVDLVLAQLVGWMIGMSLFILWFIIKLSLG